MERSWGGFLRRRPLAELNGSAAPPPALPVIAPPEQTVSAHPGAVDSGSDLLRLERDLLLKQRDLLLQERDELLALVLAALDGYSETSAAADVRLVAVSTERELMRAAGCGLRAAQPVCACGLGDGILSES